MTRQFVQFNGGIEGIWGTETACFGLMWWTQVRDGERYFAHSGSLSGYTAFLLGIATVSLVLPSLPMETGNIRTFSNWPIGQWI